MGASNRGLLGGLVMVLVFSGLWSGFEFGSTETYAEEGRQTRKIVRLYTGADNKSHFEDLQIPLKDGGKVGFVSELTKATGVVFRETTGDYDYERGISRRCWTFRRRNWLMSFGEESAAPVQTVWRKPGKWESPKWLFREPWIWSTISPMPSLPNSATGFST